MSPPARFRPRLPVFRSTLAFLLRSGATCLPSCSEVALRPDPACGRAFLGLSDDCENVRTGCQRSEMGERLCVSLGMSGSYWVVRTSSHTGCVLTGDNWPGLEGATGPSRQAAGPLAPYHPVCVVVLLNSHMPHNDILVNGGPHAPRRPAGRTELGSPSERGGRVAHGDASPPGALGHTFPVTRSASF